MEACAALADPIRKQIVELLASGDRTAGDIAARFAVTRPAISRHLRVLRESGLATFRGDAQRRIYQLDTAPLVELQDWIGAQRRLWDGRLDALGRHLDTMEAKRRSRR